MGGRKPGYAMSALLGASAVLVTTLAYYIPDMREAVFFKPQRSRVEAAVLHLAEREKAFRSAKGRFVSFGVANRSALQTLAVNPQAWPTDNFQFDARDTPEKGLRIRALPRADAVQGLQVDARMFVADLAPSGSVRSSGWYP
jgi:hypothetical protein